MGNTNQFISFEQGDMAYRFLPSGDIYSFTGGDILINHLRGSMKDGSANNIYLRVYEGDAIKLYPLLGIRSDSSLSAGESTLVYEGTAGAVSYKVTFQAVNRIWFWNITLWGGGREVDLLYGQDLGMGSVSAVLTNELYIAQYLGHSLFDGPGGRTVCSRQNMPQEGAFPYVQQGVIGAKAVRCSTDGLQFFGLSYKDTQMPEAALTDLEDTNLQYEFPYIALQTERFILEGRRDVSFYGLFLPDHPEAVASLKFGEEIARAHGKAVFGGEGLQPLPQIRIREEFAPAYSSPAFTREETEHYFPERILEEYSGDTLFSFFTKEHAHVVTKEKELSSIRPHGTIIMTPPDPGKLETPLIASTQYMYGVFNSHVAVGNTDYHKLLSTPRGFLNIIKNSGQRLYVRLEGKYRQLALPALYEMGMNYSRWFYKLKGDVLRVTAYTACGSPGLVTEIESLFGQRYDFILTHQFSVGPAENLSPVAFNAIEGGAALSLATKEYPELCYSLRFPGQAFTLSGDSLFYENGVSCDGSILAVSLPDTKRIQMLISGRLSGGDALEKDISGFEEERRSALSRYGSLINHFRLSGAEAWGERASILNETVWWYAHNAMIHFAMPHGLEQPGGAAWGTRDVCQGPMEFFLATHNGAMMRQILLNVFSHQSAVTMEWPQWFMFDRYELNAGECHGDVLFWPLKGVADYLQATGDESILLEKLPYLERNREPETLLIHIRNAFEAVRSHRLIGDSGLITYAGGDWDDTLQPAREELKQKLVSSWTMALAYQTFDCLAQALQKADGELSRELSSLADKVKEAFEKFLIKDKVIAGFAECGGEYRLMLHPVDNETGIHYRLLPMTRSIIAGLADREQAYKNTGLIQQHLKYPDGVRLMNRPPHYEGGISRLFKRAEQAANVGREISLQYTHAHIRYIEAMAKLGDGREAWDSLFSINPILLQKTVPHGGIRQSNMYFSSSDGAFADRYDYERHFSLLKTGGIPVNGGWRLYSSGPGIYIRQLVSGVLGIRFVKDGLILDPVLPKELHGLALTYACWGKPLRFVFRFDGEAPCIRNEGREIPHERVHNPYRQGGLFVRKDALLPLSGDITVGLRPKSDEASTS